ncbi:sulfatase [Arenibacter sp. TNZ]|uniref:sulfatase-like hydrolase/transferase n=1 Tax=Arenibacter TaxID=178469 RepID=UPI000CD47D38|nr:MULTISPECIES: sulfatase-like hydrolase/transferase [Arenibacter]MCM4170856.1 sulfatase [Arenibacter sp. TNZ]
MKLKIFTKGILLVTFIAVYGYSNAQDRPNVIIIYTDDQGTVDLNSYGATDLVTPNMDKLVEDGVKFTQFYASPICSPSRASLLTGKTPQRAGSPGNAGANPNSNNGLPGAEYTMAEMFKDAGYATAHIGKWHLGYQPEMSPNAQGFDYSFGHLVGCIDNYSHYFYWNGPNRHDLYQNGKEVFYDGAFFPDLMVKEASSFLEQNTEQPFFMYFAMNLPHYPYQGDTKWLEYYRENGVAYPRDLYAAFLSTQDERIGQLIKKIEELGLIENTIIVFQSDNGHSTEERAHGGGGSAGIYRGAKQCLFEGGIRVPAAISWPGKISSGEVRDQFAVNTDWMPTLAQLCGIQLDTKELDGKSLMPVISNGKSNTLHTDGYCWAFKDMWVARKGKWKLLGNPYDTSQREYTFSEKLFLVNLEKDPGERNNLAVKYPDKVKELENQYRKWLVENKNN